MITLDQFYAKHKGQSLLWAPSPAREYLRGQCVQLAAFYVEEVWGLPTIWDDAYNWFVDGRLADKYDRIKFTGKNRPPRGALVIFDKTLPGSGGAGHIDVCWDPGAPGAPTWVGFDQNWGGKTSKLVTHNWSYVVGWIVPKGGKGAGPAPAPKPTTPVPAPAPAKEADEMIANTDQAQKMYKILRPNGSGSAAEIAATAGKRTYANFVNDAQNEVNQRDANLRAQAQHMADLQTTIDGLNATITKMNTEGVKSKQEYDAAMAQIAELTTQLTTTHDQLKDLQALVPGPVQDLATTAAKQPAANAQKPSLIVRLLAGLLRSHK